MISHIQLLSFQATLNIPLPGTNLELLTSARTERKLTDDNQQLVATLSGIKQRPLVMTHATRYEASCDSLEIFPMETIC